MSCFCKFSKSWSTRNIHHMRLSLNLFTLDCGWKQKLKKWKLSNKWTVLHCEKKKNIITHENENLYWKIQYCTEFNKASNQPNLTIKKSHKMMNWQYTVVFSYIYAIKLLEELRYLHSLRALIIIAKVFSLCLAYRFPFLQNMEGFTEAEFHLYNQQSLST